MKSPTASIPSLRFVFGLILVFAGGLRESPAQVTPQLNPDQLDQLLGPIALYPDALVALILPASTVPGDIVLAQRYLSNGGDPDQIDYQPWNDSVKGLARYPMLIQWMDENLTWTQQLGNAFLNQPDTVMESVQHLRARARANGTLTSTPQQKLVLDGDIIEIVPAQPDVIYVPYYDPNLVYGEPGYYGGPPYVTFGLGFAAGYWLAYDFNWHSHVVIVGDRHHNWYEHHDWDHHSGAGGRPNYGNNWHPWTAPVRAPSTSRPDSHRPPPSVVRPKPLPRNPSTPARPEHSRPDYNSRDSDHNRPPAPSNNPARTQDNRDHRPPVNFGPQSEPRPQSSAPQPGPHPQSSPPLPVPNPQASNPPRPTSHASPSTPGPHGGRDNPRPDSQAGNPPRPSQGNPPLPGPHADRDGPRPNPNPNAHPPGPVPTRQAPSRPPVPVQDATPPSYPAAPQPAAPPPSRNAPRDDRPEVQR